MLSNTMSEVDTLLTVEVKDMVSEEKQEMHGNEEVPKMEGEASVDDDEQIHAKPSDAAKPLKPVQAMEEVAENPAGSSSKHKQKKKKKKSKKKSSSSKSSKTGTRKKVSPEMMKELRNMEPLLEPKTKKNSSFRSNDSSSLDIPNDDDTTSSSIINALQNSMSGITAAPSSDKSQNRSEFADMVLPQETTTDETVKPELKGKSGGSADNTEETADDDSYSSSSNSSFDLLHANATKYTASTQDEDILTEDSSNISTEEVSTVCTSESSLHLASVEELQAELGRRLGRSVDLSEGSHEPTKQSQQQDRSSSEVYHDSMETNQSKPDAVATAEAPDLQKTASSSKKSKKKEAHYSSALDVAEAKGKPKSTNEDSKTAATPKPITSIFGAAMAQQSIQTRKPESRATTIGNEARKEPVDSKMAAKPKPIKSIFGAAMAQQNNRASKPESPKNKADTEAQQEPADSKLAIKSKPITSIFGAAMAQQSNQDKKPPCARSEVDTEQEAEEAKIAAKPKPITSIFGAAMAQQQNQSQKPQVGPSEDTKTAAGPKPISSIFGAAMAQKHQASPSEVGTGKQPEDSKPAAKPKPITSIFGAAMAQKIDHSDTENQGLGSSGNLQKAPVSSLKKSKKSGQSLSWAADALAKPSSPMNPDTVEPVSPREGEVSHESGSESQLPKKKREAKEERFNR